jgi:glucuronoarabinoxylan endo-1,4-beta-xylanase
MMTIPFQASIPEGVQAFNLSFFNGAINGSLITSGSIPANTPVLVNGFGAFVFEGSGRIDPIPNLKAGISFGIYVGIKVPLGGYYLKVENGVPTFSRVTNTPAQPFVNAFDAYLTLGAEQTTALSLPVILDAVLPVTVSIFTAKANGKNVLLDWETRTEINNSGFAVERSADGSNFGQIGFVKANGNSNAHILYHFTDQSPMKGHNFYRLKQIDINGKFSYSNVKLVKFGADPIVTLYPNPVKNELRIDGNGEKLNGTMVVLDAVGRVVLQSNINAAEMQRIDVSSLAKGIYFYRFNQVNGSFIKQ